MGAFVNSKQSGKARPGGGKPEGGDPAEALFPALWEYLTLQAWDDGSEREVATLMVFFEGGLWKAWLNDRAEGRSAWASGSSTSGALEALEQGLASGKVEWRCRPATGSKQGKRS